MQPLTIAVRGRYWDSILYNNHLMLITLDGALEVYNWDRLIDTIKLSSENERATLRHSFARGRAWYALAIQDLLKSPPFTGVFQASIDRLRQAELVISRRDLAKALLIAVNVDDFPTTDVEIFANTLFSASTDGIAETSLRNIKEINLSRAARISDVPALRISASYGTLAVAAGEEGLHEIDISGVRDSMHDLFGEPSDPTMNVSSAPAYACSWSSFDVVASSPTGGYVGAFSPPATRDPAEYSERHLIGTVSDTQIFGRSDGFMFGGYGAIIQATADGYQISGWNPYKRDQERGTDVRSTLTNLPHPVEMPRQVSPIDAALTAYGVVYEYSNSLVVSGTDGVVRSFRREPINWRTFPRSQRYMNHLHIVRSDRLDVHAFTHDYFLDPSERGVGLKQPTASSW